MLEWRPIRAWIVFRLNLYGICRIDGVCGRSKEASRDYAFEN